MSNPYPILSLSLSLSLLLYLHDITSHDAMYPQGEPTEVYTPPLSQLTDTDREELALVKAGAQGLGLGSSLLAVVADPVMYHTVEHDRSVSFEEVRVTMITMTIACDHDDVNDDE